MADGSGLRTVCGTAMILPLARGHRQRRDSGPFGGNQKLAVSGRARKAIDGAFDLEAEALEIGNSISDNHPRVYGESGTTPPFPTSALPASNCGFTSTQAHASVGRNAAIGGGEDQPEGNEREVGTAPQGSSTFSRGHSRARAPSPADPPEPGMELTVSDIDGEDAGRAALEQHVGEAAGGGAEIEAEAPATGRAK